VVGTLGIVTPQRVAAEVVLEVAVHAVNVIRVALRDVVLEDG